MERRKKMEEKLWLISKLSMSKFHFLLNGYVPFNGCPRTLEFEQGGCSS
jgi:hypothetical protein